MTRNAAISVPASPGSIWCGRSARPAALPDGCATHPADGILQCPSTRAPLRLLTSRETAVINEQIARDNVARFDGSPVRHRLRAGFVTPGRERVYPIQDGVVLLLPALAYDLRAAHRRGRTATELAVGKLAAQNFYDEIGWRRGENGVFNDAAEFEDLREITREYRERCHRRVSDFLPARGRFLLDAASGPIQYEAYNHYSDSFEFRVCVDLSYVALREARRKLGDRGIYLLADVTQLPIRDGAIDAVVSLHTLYHVPADEQPAALRELHRVLKPGGSGVVVYSWGEHAALMQLALLRFPWLKPLRRRLHWYAGKFRSVLRGSPPVSTSAGRQPPAATAALYFHAHRPGWWLRRPWGFGLELRCWRSVHVDFLKRMIRSTWYGNAVLRALYRLEQRFPRFFGRWGQYPMFVLRK